MASTYRSLVKWKNISVDIGLQPVPNKAQIPQPIGDDNCTFHMVIEMLCASQFPGWNDKTYT